MAECLHKVEQTPFQLMHAGMVPALTCLGEHRLLKHGYKEVKLAIAHCLSELIRVTAPKTPYKDDKM